MVEYDYTEAEWSRRQELLKQAGITLKEYMEKYSSFAAVYLPPFRTLSLHCEIRPKIVSADDWEKIHQDIARKAPEIANQINTDPQNRLGNRLMRCRILDNPVSRWQAGESMRDMHTGQRAKSTKLENMGVIFSFPYTHPLK